jgi:hypothetical protein
VADRQLRAFKLWPLEQVVATPSRRRREAGYYYMAVDSFSLAERVKNGGRYCILARLAPDRSSGETCERGWSPESRWSMDLGRVASRSPRKSTYGCSKSNVVFFFTTVSNINTCSEVYMQAYGMSTLQP